jgi:DGQHR domain-containing protein
MTKVEVLGKKNRDGSYSASIPAHELIDNSFVDFYEDAIGDGYQRREAQRATRGREIQAYLRRCVENGLEPKLFEMTANARLENENWKFDAVDDDGLLGILSLEASDGKKWLSVIDGGTRSLGIENALTNRIIDPDTTFDVRIFIGLSLAEEIAQFLLINEKQKRVRTDLSIRVVQRKLDEDTLTDDERRILETVVPDSDTWKFQASRIAGILNEDPDSPWCGLIQMPNDNVTGPVKLQGFSQSLKPILTHENIKTRLSQMADEGILRSGGQILDSTGFIIHVLKNFWNAVAEVNPDAHAEPRTTVLWGSIGVNACHTAFGPILDTILDSSNPSLTQDRFEAMLEQTNVSDYDFWFSRAGSIRDQTDYPSEKGEATTMVGAANHRRLGRDIETECRAALHSESNRPAPVL